MIIPRWGHFTLVPLSRYYHHRVSQRYNVMWRETRGVKSSTMSRLYHEESATPPTESRPNPEVILSALVGGAAFGLLVADLLATPLLIGWVLLVLAVGIQLVSLLRQPGSSTPQGSLRPPLWFWLALLVMLAAFALIRLYFG
jgi:hypothetical protein